MDAGDIEARVWAAIYAALKARGDADIRAGLAWLTVEDERAIARAAIDAVGRAAPDTLTPTG